MWLSRAILDTSHKIKVSATPRTERGTAHTPSNGVAETWLHETAVHESGYGDFALMSAVVGSDGVSLRRDDSKIRDEPCSPESLCLRSKAMVEWRSRPKWCAGSCWW
jgi:hypothetical protein